MCLANRHGVISRQRRLAVDLGTRKQVGRHERARIRELDSAQLNQHCVSQAVSHSDKTIMDKSTFIWQTADFAKSSSHIRRLSTPSQLCPIPELDFPISIEWHLTRATRWHLCAAWDVESVRQVNSCLQCLGDSSDFLETIFKQVWTSNFDFEVDHNYKFWFVTNHHRNPPAVVHRWHGTRYQFVAAS